MPIQIKDGSKTSEYSIAKWLAIAGVALQALAGALSTALPDAPWVPIVLAASGAATAIAAALGYQIPRASIKRQVAIKNRCEDI